jgi:hypothetical protein
MNPIEQLKSVLCDQDGKCCIHGSLEDRAIVDAAISELSCRAALAEPAQEPVAFISHNVLNGKNWYDKVPLQSLQPGAYTYTPLYTAPQPQPLTVPQGWKLVPVEPTDAMIHAAANLDFLTFVEDAPTYADTYKAMLAAAPEAPAVQTVSIQRFFRVEEELAAMTDEFMRVANELATLKQSVPPAVQPLTDEQINQLIPSAYVNDVYMGYSRTDLCQLARAIEAAHGIKETK